MRPLTAREGAALIAVTSSGRERVGRVRRATALRAVTPGETLAAAAERAGFRSDTTVAGLVGRFNRRGLAALDVAAGRGRKPTSGVAARAQIVATAQRAPDRRRDGTAPWSLSTLERSLRRDARPHVGATTSRRVLEAAGSSSQKTRTWCPTGTALRQRQAGVVTVTDPRTEEKSNCLACQALTA